MPKIHLPTPLRPYAEGATTVETGGATVAEALEALVARHEGLRRHLFDEKGRLRSFVNVYRNEEDVRYLDRERTAVSQGDALSIIPSIAGGSSAPVVDALSLSNEEIRRYARHLIMPEVGLDGQKKLKAARVLAVGTGGLGSPLALYLAAAGIGHLGLVDADVVDESNLQRQLLHGTRDVGRPKLESARDRIRDVNPHVEVRLHEMFLSSDNALEIFQDYDVVADGTDNFPTRYLVNDACVLSGKPNVYGSIFRFEGQASVFAVRDGPCYRCLYPEPPPPGLVPSCAEGGVLGILPGIVGLIQANEVVKLVLGIGEPLVGRLLLFDALGMRFRELKLRRDPACPVCGPHPSVTRLIDYQEFCGVRPDVDLTSGELREITARELKVRLDAGDDLAILDVREVQEFELCRLAGARLIPLGELAGRLAELDSTREMVVHCRTGKRSAQAIELLEQAGFSGSRLWNLKGGIHAWADEVDPSIPKY